MLPYVYLVRYGRTAWGRAEGARAARPSSSNGALVSAFRYHQVMDGIFLL